jgi:molybdopterin converting factor subunit 1
MTSFIIGELMVKVLFFATLKEKSGTRQAEFDLPAGTTIAQLKSMAVERFPALKEALDHCLASVNHHYSADEREIPIEAEVAFFPPVSGG